MGDTSDQRRERELVLAPNEFAYILDKTKGNVDVYVGPHKSSLADTDQPVSFDDKSKRFKHVGLSEAIQTTKIAPEGWYIIQKNPAVNGSTPKPGQRQSLPELEAGHKVNIHGPCGFALWPGQMARILQGHHIRSNQYLRVRVYDEAAAKKNWGASIIKAKDGEDSKALLGATPDLTIGSTIIIRGTDASFYIPPTGIEVVPDEAGQLVRDAVTLERLEYCLLLDENGSKRFERGPAVVFPQPTEIFKTRDKKDESGESTQEVTRKFRAIELNETSGIYIKVISDYTDESGEHKVGEELFITGKDTSLYFPREEHAITKYGNQEVHYATAIPEGEGRYVLNRRTSNIRLVFGPEMFLPDPRQEVITRRVLDAKTCELLYPGNAEALEHNISLLPKPESKMMLSAAASVGGAGSATYTSGQEMARYALQDMALNASFGASASVSDDAAARGLRGRVGKSFTGDSFDRKNTYTEPRTVILNTKYQGAVTTSIFTGYAMLLVRKNGKRRVVQGPQTVMLEYDEIPQVIEVSTGKPKTTDKLYRTVFLRVQANKVADIIEAETQDFVKVSIKLSYRVNFEGDNPEQWFKVENYVKFLCDHLRSKVRSAVRKLKVEEFFTNSEDLVRDVVLGKTGPAGRDGMLFSENNMRIYDVEILNVSLQDASVEKLLVDSQRAAINHHLALQNSRRDLEFVKENEGIKREKSKAEQDTRTAKMILEQEELSQKLLLDLASIDSQRKTNDLRQATDKAKEEGVNLISTLVLERSRAVIDQQIATENSQADLRIRELLAEAQAVINKAEAISPELIAALTAFGDKAMVEKVASAMAPLSILGGGKRSVMEIVAEMLKGTNLAKQLPLVASNGSNGSSVKDTATA